MTCHGPSSPESGFDVCLTFQPQRPNIVDHERWRQWVDKRMQAYLMRRRPNYSQARLPAWRSLASRDRLAMVTRGGIMSWFQELGRS